MPRRSPGLPASLLRPALLAAGLALLAALAPASPAAAQGVDSTLVARYQLAESYLRGGQFDRAIRLLEDLHARSPGTHVFYEKLKEAYESVKRYDEAIALVEARRERGADGPLLRAEEGRLYYLAGREDDAEAAWRAAIAAAPQEAGAYRAVYQALMGLRLFEQAAETLQQARDALGDPALFTTDLAYLYSLNGQHTEAAREYLTLLADAPGRVNFVRSRLSRFIEQDGALDATIASVEAAVREEPLHRGYRELLAWLYLEGGHYREAFDANRAIDRLEQENGAVLLTFARQAADAGAFDVAHDAYREILERYPDAPLVAEARLGLGVMLEEQAAQAGERAYDARGQRQDAPRYDQALAAYRTFLQEHPADPAYPDVLRRIGRLQQDVFFRLGEAEATLGEVVARYPRSDAAAEAAYDLGRIAVERGRLDEARLAFSRLEEAERTGERAERARYQLALLHLYRGELDAAKTRVQAMQENTSTDVANDAIALKVLLQENRGPDSLNTALKRYGEVLLLERQRRPDAALDGLDRLLADFGGHPIADDARYRRATLLRDLGRTDEALALLLEFPLIHPTSPLADRALFDAGELQDQELGDAEAALDTYTRLLTEYPGSLLVPEARARIRVLRGDVNS